MYIQAYARKYTYTKAHARSEQITQTVITMICSAIKIFGSKQIVVCIYTRLLPALFLATPKLLAFYSSSSIRRLKSNQRSTLVITHISVPSSGYNR